MKALASIGVAAVLLLASASGGARQLPVGGHRSPTPAPHHHGGKPGFRGGFPIFVIERAPTVIIEREVVRELAAAPEPAPPPPPPPREPYVIGRSYSSLPGGCMKLIEDGESYYYCGGEWYRQIGGGSRARYQAVARP